MARSSRISRSVKVYRVGGSVRDELLGRAITDRDWVVVGATPEILLASGYKPVGRDFPVFLHPDTREEFALARTERKHGRGYRGFEFFVSPDVTLDEDLARRDLTINAMARDERGTLIDPFGGAADLEARVLRHVSPAFVEDPLRVLRVARFAARFGFAVAPETAALMRRLVASGELAELAPERVWQELSRGLMEAHPSRMLAVLHDCGALAGLLPEVGALFAARRAATPGQPIDPGTHVARALDFAAAKAFALTVRYAILAGDLGVAKSPASGKPKGHPRAVRNVRLAERVSRRLRAPVDCRDAARLAARWLRVVHRAADLRAAALLDLLIAADALRRPERLDALLGACESDARSWPGAEGDYEAARVVRAALAIVKDVDAAAVARGVMATRKVAGTERADAVGKAVRAARLRALRDWRRSAALPLRKASSA